jgi:hypothetical protein
LTEQHSGDLCNHLEFGYKRIMQFPAKAAAMSFFLCCLIAVPAAPAQESQHKTAAPRPLTRHEGLAIVRTALYSRHHESDCSHLVHAVYERVGFTYDYAPSSDLYSGTEKFRRMTKPQPGDLAVWRGHAGIVVNPAQHSFFSLLSSGPGVDCWDSSYWKQWGRPRFFRYLKRDANALSGSTRSANLKQ